MAAENILLRCPQGHELQAARSDIGRTLTCPICRSAFVFAVPGATPPAITAPGQPPLLSCASLAHPPADRPQYTKIMLGLWILLDSLSLATQLILAAMGSDMTDFSSSPLFAANAGVGCVALMAFVAMAVLQLMWVYRVHLDAGHGGYAEVSPGLALGLCFVPLFNFVWLAIVLRKLAGFAALATDRPNASAAVRLANICLVSNSLRLVLGVAGGIYGVVVGLQAAQTAGVNPNQPFYPFAGSSFAWEPWMLITPVLNLAMTVVYLWTVWRVETSLYAKIGPAA